MPLPGVHPRQNVFRPRFVPSPKSAAASSPKGKVKVTSPASPTSPWDKRKKVWQRDFLVNDLDFGLVTVKVNLMSYHKVFELSRMFCVITLFILQFIWNFVNHYNFVQITWQRSEPWLKTNPQNQLVHRDVVLGPLKKKQNRRRLTDLGDSIGLHSKVWTT